jgi:hypothetical protein
VIEPARLREGEELVIDVTVCGRCADVLVFGTDQQWHNYPVDKLPPEMRREVSKAVERICSLAGTAVN